MREVRPGVWHWQAPHPDWGEEEWWPQPVSSYPIGLGDDFVLFDPLSVPDALRERATAVVLTAPYHERDARGLGLPIHTPPADRSTRRRQTLGRTGSRSSASTPTRCAAWRARISPGCGRAKAKGTSTGPEHGPSAPTRTPAARTTTSSSGCRRSPRSSAATRCPTSATAWTSSSAAASTLRATTS